MCRVGRGAPPPPRAPSPPPGKTTPTPPWRWATRSAPSTRCWPLFWLPTAPRTATSTWRLPNDCGGRICTPPCRASQPAPRLTRPLAPRQCWSWASCQAPGQRAWLRVTCPRLVRCCGSGTPAWRCSAPAWAALLAWLVWRGGGSCVPPCEALPSCRMRTHRPEQGATATQWQPAWPASAKPSGRKPA